MNDSTVAKYYENDPNARVWQENAGERREIGLYIGHCIAEEIDFPRSENGKTIILSAASNVGVMEQGIQEQAGDNYLVVANDFANLPRVSGVEPLRSDARELPFANESIPCIVDVAGALWHQLADDMLDRKLVGKKSEKGARIILEYLSKLKPGGVLLVDDGFDKSTGQLLDEIFADDPIVGFVEPTIIGDENFKMRIYRKQEGESI